MKAGLAEYEQMVAIQKVATEFEQQTAKVAELSGDVEVLVDEMAKLSAKVDRVLELLTTHPHNPKRPGT